MQTKAPQSQSTIQDSSKAHLSPAEAAERDLYQRLSKLHRDHLRPVGPIEQTLVETIIHNCFQIHHIQQAERDIRTFNSTPSLMNLGRLARYRAYLEHSTAKSLAQLSDIQHRRREAKPAVMTASVSSSPSDAAPRPVKSAGHSEPIRLPIPHPIDQPVSPFDSAAHPSSPAATAIPSAPPIHGPTPPRQIEPDPQDR